MVPGAAGGGADREELAEAVAEQLLHRWGVVFRDLAVRDSLRMPWRDLQWALRRLEDRGLVRGGRFVTGFSGEQYALPEAAEQLAHVRKAPRTGERVVLNATDPLNLVGLDRSRRRHSRRAHQPRRLCRRGAVAGPQRRAGAGCYEDLAIRRTKSTSAGFTMSGSVMLAA